MEKLIEYIASNLVDDPEVVKVDVVGKGHTMIYELRVAENDRGRVIGKEGVTIQSIRTLLKAAAASDQKPMLEIPD